MSLNHLAPNLGLDGDSREEIWEFCALFIVKLFIEELRGFACGSRYVDLSSASS
jgi:hypothetical protein